jgi:hypothetical protein
MPAPKGHAPYPGCEKGGMPPQYTKEIIEDYADKFKVWLQDEKSVWFKDFALDNDFDPDFLSEWAKKNEKFSGVYKIAKHRQESRLVNGGLGSKYNNAIVKLVLTNHHGYADKQQTVISGDSANPLQVIYNEVTGTTKDLIADAD